MALVSVAYGDLVRSKAIMEAGSSKTNDSSTGQAVTFTLDFTEPAKKPGRMPKNLSAARNRKHELSQASIAEKQRMAEQRRKKHIEDRLERIHQLEEEAQRLAQAMAPLIQASNCNGLPPRKLHRDGDIIRTTTDCEPVGIKSEAGDDTNHIENSDFTH